MLELFKLNVMIIALRHWPDPCPRPFSSIVFNDRFEKLVSRMSRTRNDYSSLLKARNDEIVT